MAGDGPKTRLKFEPCASWSPHEAGVRKIGKRQEPCPVQCNRPYGHDGNHMCLNGAFDRLAEWGPAEVIR